MKAGPRLFDFSTMTPAPEMMPEYVKVRLEMKRLRKRSSGKRKERAKIEIEIPFYDMHYHLTCFNHVVISDLNNISFYLGRV